MNEQDKLIEEQIKTLPPDLVRAIQAMPWKKLVREVGEQNNLTEEQISALEQETMFILYAFEPPEDYISNLLREMGVTEDVAFGIAETINEKIFEPILTKSEELKGKDKEEPEALTSVLEIPSENLPVIEPPFAQDVIMVKKGEAAHTVPHVEQPTTPPIAPRTSPAPGPTPTSPPPPKIEPQQNQAPGFDSRYPGGKDPYREPLV